MLAPNKVIGGKYKIVGGRLGIGNFGVVRLGYEMGTKRRQDIVRSGPLKFSWCRVAVKMEKPMRRKQKFLNSQLRNEFQILSLLNKNGTKLLKIYPDSKMIP